MSNKTNFSFAIVAAIISVGAAVSFASPTQASALLDKCQPSANRTVVERCCTMWTKAHGVPIWMSQTGASCNQAVVCKGGAAPTTPTLTALVVNKKPKCQIVMEDKLGGGSSNPKLPTLRNLKP